MREARDHWNRHEIDGAQELREQVLEDWMPAISDAQEKAKAAPDSAKRAPAQRAVMSSMYPLPAQTKASSLD